MTRPGCPATEFLVISKSDRAEHVERLAMTVYYHHMHTLGLGHTFPLGEAWEPGASLHHALVSRPYPYGPLLEQFPVSDTEHGHIPWVLPITSAELEFKKKHGLEALERRFEDLRHWDTARASVV